MSRTERCQSLDDEDFGANSIASPVCSSAIRSLSALPSFASASSLECLGDGDGDVHGVRSIGAPNADFILRHMHAVSLGMESLPSEVIATTWKHGRPVSSSGSSNVTDSAVVFCAARPDVCGFTW